MNSAEMANKRQNAADEQKPADAEYLQSLATRLALLMTDAGRTKKGNDRIKSRVAVTIGQLSGQWAAII